jgi:GNAT superfamily N-acetyltransferase
MENLNLNKKENITPKADILSYETLLKQIYKGENLPQDKRFLSTEKGGVFKYFELSNLNDMYSKDRFYPVIKLNDEIVALSEIEKNNLKENNYWIKFISVDPKYQNNGYATKLIENIFKFAKENNYSLETSIYSDEGIEKIKNIVDKFEKETGVNVIKRSYF